MPDKPSAKKKQLNREMVLRALTDAKFRKLLKSDPAKALGKEVTPVHRREIDLVLATLRGIEAQIQGIADELLCANGPCGIA